MNEKEVAEIRRRFRTEHNSITSIRGCCVNQEGEIISQFNQSMGLMSQDDAEMFLATVRRTLAGTLGKNLRDIAFTTQQVMDSQEHKLLMALREKEPSEEALTAFYKRVIETVYFESSYLILLVRDAYDVPTRGKDGVDLEDSSEETFSYLLCSICPMKLTKPALSYHAEKNEFNHLGVDWAVSPPELGFMFPAFDDRSANIYGALYYTKNSGENYPSFVNTLFNAPLPMAADLQKETFESLLGETLAEECSYQVVQGVQDQLCQMLQEHKESKEPQPLTISKATVGQILAAKGVSPQKAQAFESRFAETFGPEASISPQNVVDTKAMAVCTPDVTIKVSPDRGDLLETRTIDGVKYILIRAGEGVEVNGVNIHIE